MNVECKKADGTWQVRVTVAGTATDFDMEKDTCLVISYPNIITPVFSRAPVDAKTVAESGSNPNIAVLAAGVVLGVVMATIAICTFFTSVAVKGAN